MKKLIIISFLNIMCVQMRAQQVQNYKVDLKLSDLKVYGSISLADIGETDIEGSEFLTRVNGAISVEKVNFDFWTFKKSEDEFYFSSTQRGEAGWDLSMLTLNELSSSLTIKNVNFAIGDDISKLNSLYPTAYAQRGLNKRTNTYCAILEIGRLTGGITLVYNNSTGKITKIKFVQLLH